ncbi:FAD-dependent oxidoreductase [Saccharibacillus sp. CPCC 101409]|uniref:FAD-dependent oxidoreductase n=1 Tax=Saccharibacillus sp. CPCC 101409 TaxID=3058041 RepID=UPI0026728F98|nr:FAD-dependent oxidoreductase [Saccharibacillus sp. CPCC 101409]MDO3410130.1 FAD-dependent oxidoreductase [Saccharibacillus sp. CPCC 101409]
MSEKFNVPSELPRYPQSMWRTITTLPTFPELREDIEVDVTVVGAGIAGVTTAYLLSLEGYKVALIDAGRILDGTTGYTTAKISAQHGMIYSEFLTNFRPEIAKAYYEANDEALRFIRETVRANDIDCDFKEETAYVYTNQEDKVDDLRKEFDAYQELGIPGQWHEGLPIPVEAKAAISMPGQAQFNPLKYLKFLVEKIVENGGVVYENTTIEDAEYGKPIQVFTTDKANTIRCNEMVVASHYPFWNFQAGYFSRLKIERSYALAVKPETTFQGGMYVSIDDEKRSIRSATFEGEEVLIVGGENHEPGKSDKTFDHYLALEKFAGTTFGVTEIPFRWSAQDITTLDKIPYIGPFSSDYPFVFIATGFNKWGMTNGTVAGLLLRDNILRRTNPYMDVFNPGRFNDKSMNQNIVTGFKMAKELIAGKFAGAHEKLSNLEPDQGALVRHHGKKVGAYRDPQGELFLVDTTCTHMGCETAWNEAERSWDCPCHGSRFSYSGEVLEGPAKEPLKRVEE